MELAIATCPDLFIEPGLSLVRRQAVINGRRPDILFTDRLSRHLLVEIQRGRLDEEHLQRHFYYYFDYRAQNPSTHLRLMFIANRLVPQHQKFLDEHGYEFREYAEGEFERRAADCRIRHPELGKPKIERVETPEILLPTTHQLLFEIESEKMTLCYKMLLLAYMAEFADEDGAVPIRMLADKFQEFFIGRSLQNKVLENPNVVEQDSIATRTLSSWERTIRDQPVTHLTERFVCLSGTSLVWAPRIRSIWNAQLKTQIHLAATDRLIRYFNKYVPGGY